MFDVFARPDVFMFCISAAGLAFGSFLNVVIARLPRIVREEAEDEARDLNGQEPLEREPFSLSFPSSRCPSCGRKIRAFENVPLLSWVLLKGRCKGCSNPISARYPLVEAAGGFFGLACAAHFGPGLAACAALGFCLAQLALCLIDAETLLLPDRIVQPLIWSGLALALAGGPVPLRDAVVGAMAGYLPLWMLFTAHKALTGREGMGRGDFKLMAALGAWLGWKALLPLFPLAGLLAAVYGLCARATGRDLVPFGPAIAAAGVLGLFFLPQMLAAVALLSRF